MCGDQHGVQVNDQRRLHRDRLVGGIDTSPGPVWARTTARARSIADKPRGASKATFTSVIFSFATFAAGYLARPLGGVIFGHFGDRLGRKKMLVLTMMIMGESFLIGLVPGAPAIGPWGAIILVLLRICQGIAVGGEWGGAAVMALEHSDAKQRGFSASFVNAGAPSGALLGSLMMGLSDRFGRRPVLLATIEQQPARSPLSRVPGLKIASRNSQR